MDDLHDLIRRYQSGEGDDNNWEWHRLVPKEAIESLPKTEVIRQSAIFELINGERNYVRDLELVQEVSDFPWWKILFKLSHAGIYWWFRIYHATCN